MESVEGVHLKKKCVSCIADIQLTYVSPQRDSYSSASTLLAISEALHALQAEQGTALDASSSGNGAAAPGEAQRNGLAPAGQVLGSMRAKRKRRPQPEAVAA